MPIKRPLCSRVYPLSMKRPGAKVAKETKLALNQSQERPIAQMGNPISFNVPITPDGRRLSFFPEEGSR
jgi:hypothetical protein